MWIYFDKSNGDTVLSVRPPFLMPFHTYSGITYCGNECISVGSGCMDSTAFNYDSTANTSLPCYYNPGCISPAYLEYHIDTTNGYYTDINIQDSCSTLAVFGCTDSTALNYDSLANVDNGSCSMMIVGCMNPAAYNYNMLANVSDSANCLYNANCVTGPGDPYWLNDPCYAWVIDIDNYCCENEWDTICQATYDYCEGTWIGPPLARELEENLIIYPNPTNGEININKKVDVRIINMLGDMIIREDDVNVLDVSYLIPGVYSIQIIYDNKVINRKIIKE